MTDTKDGGPVFQDSLDELERQMKSELVWLQIEYEKAAQPFIDQLVRIEQQRPPKPLIVTDPAVMAMLSARGSHE